MQIRDLSGKVTSQKLNESLAKKFGYRLKLDQFNEQQLVQVQSKLSEQIAEFERTNSFDSVVENHEYQKNRAMLDVIRQEIKERTLSPEERARKATFLEGMKKAEGKFAKKYGKDAKAKMESTAHRMAKAQSLDEAMDVLKGVLSERTLLEGEEEKAALIMSARDMVDKLTGWLEDVASMKAETMLDLVDSIRDELGNDVAEQFSNTVKPALEELYTSLEGHRTSMAQAVSILTGEEGPGGMPGAGGMGGMPGGEELGAEIGAEAPPEMGGEEMPEMPPEAGERMKRESVEYSRKLGTILSSKPKKK
jgi:hypothetical protein